ncbi:MAG: ABC transporter substrate-binding protein [Pseudomonadota bacterium]
MKCLIERIGTKFTSLLPVILLVLTPFQALGADTDRVFRVYLDADRSHNFASARSIEMGVWAALSREELHPAGVRFEITARNHRGNSKRSLKSLIEYHRDPDGLVVFGGQHSPPYLNYKDRINEDGILLLLPWSAAGPLTRTDSAENWIFRASVDDTKAGGFLVHQAVVRAGCQKPVPIFLNSGWGRANRKTITKALAKVGIPEPPVFFYDRGISEAGVRIITRDVLGTGADCVIFVGGASGGAGFVTSFANSGKPVRFFSHWGITGGRFIDETTFKDRAGVELKFLQTCLPFGASNPALAEAVSAARKLFSDEFATFETLPAAVGFAHGYDLGLLLLAALREIDTEGPIGAVRSRLRAALEMLNQPVPGIMKTYASPFSKEGFDAHEALGEEDLCLAVYEGDGRVVISARDELPSH